MSRASAFDRASRHLLRTEAARACGCPQFRLGSELALSSRKTATFSQLSPQEPDAWPITLPPLPYAYNALEPHIDARTMEIHHTKHHQAYINNVNTAIAGTDLEKLPVEKLIADLSKVPDDKRGAVRNNGGGHANHSLFWTIMGPGAGGVAVGRPGPGDQQHVRQLRQVQGAVRQGGDHAVRQRLGLARRRRAASWRSARRPIKTAR